MTGYVVMDFAMKSQTHQVFAITTITNGENAYNDGGVVKRSKLVLWRNRFMSTQVSAFIDEEIKEMMLMLKKEIPLAFRYIESLKESNQRWEGITNDAVKKIKEQVKEIRELKAKISFMEEE